MLYSNITYLIDDANYITNNAYYSGGNWYYKTDGAATMIKQASGSEYHYYAISGLTGGLIMWVLAYKYENGILSVTGYLNSKKSGAFSYLSSPADTVISEVNVYQPVSGEFTSSPVENFSKVADEPSMIYDGTHTQYFIINSSFNFTVSHACTVSISLYKNGEYVPGSLTTMYIKYGDESYALSGTTVTSMSTNDKITLMIKCDGTYTIKMSNILLNISEFFD